MPMNTTRLIWFNGEMVPWESATVHVMAHALHYGSSIFEGIRCYETPRGPAIFRLAPHIVRFQDSARIYRMPLPYSSEQLSAACHEVIRANELRSSYLRPVAYRSFGEITPHPRDTPVEVAIAAIPWGKFLSDDEERGIDVGVSSWQRPAPNTFPTLAKAGGNYLSSQLIVGEAQRHGYVEGIALDYSGNLSEGSGENLFIVRDGVVYTPPTTSSILAGVTRDAIITLARELGYQVREQSLPREILYVADELFFTGTAAEVTPIRSVDGIVVKAGGRGPVTTAIARRFFGLFTGEVEDTHGWLEYVA